MSKWIKATEKYYEIMIEGVINESMMSGFKLFASAMGYEMISTDPGSSDTMLVLKKGTWSDDEIKEYVGGGPGKISLTDKDIENMRV